jgi:hypothetical protein
VGKPRPYGEYIAGMVPGRRPVKTKTNKNSFFSFSNHFFLKEIHEYSMVFFQEPSLLCTHRMGVVSPPWHQLAITILQVWKS